MASNASQSLGDPSGEAKVTAKVNHVPQTCIVDKGCSGVIMSIGAVRGCNMIHSIDRAAGARHFRIASGQMEAPLGLIREVPIAIAPSQCL